MSARTAGGALVIVQVAALLAACAGTGQPVPTRLPAPPAVADAVSAAAAVDTRVLALAARSGCTACHSVDPSPRALADPDLAPVGPYWRDVANHYRGTPGALARLTRTVVGGSDPYQPHWQGVAGLAMPAQRIVVSPAEVQELLRWILALPPEASDAPAAR